MKKKIKLSIVTSLFHSEKYIEEFYRKIIESINEINIKDYELIFVNDASPDNSLKIVLELFKKYKKISIIDFSKNFGHHKALMTGLEKASGEYVFLIDVDLEENPDLLVYFWREIHKKENYNNVDLVYGILDKRRGGFFQRFLGNVFYKILLFLTDGEIPKNVLMARLMTQRYKNALVSHRDKNIFIPGLSAITGYTQLPLKCKKGTQSSSSYTFIKRVILAVDSITSFSSKPLKYIFYIGIIILLFSVIYIIYLILMKFFNAFSVDGWTSLIVSIYFLCGLILSSLGVLAIYLSKIYDEVKDRPTTIIKKIWLKRN